MTPSFTDIYGYNPSKLLTSQNEAWRRLLEMLSDKVLRFNPYSVDDATLLMCVGRGIWQPFPALTQMLVFHFHDIRSIGHECPYDAIFFHAGDDASERHLPVRCLTEKITYAATLRQVHVEVNGHAVTNERMVEKMQGKDYFMGHALPADTTLRSQMPAYRMFRLKGTSRQCADIIRRQMVESKIRMLEEVLSHPYCMAYLQCSRDFIDYATPIQEAIDVIRRFPNDQVP